MHRENHQGVGGEDRNLRLEMQVLADVGLLGFPNAGKSSFIRQVSAARPKVADYPFTTLHPNLGVVSLDVGQSFVVADIPGLIEGAADGAGLGIQFLKHLSRTRLLLHIVDIGIDKSVDSLLTEIETIVSELKNYRSSLAGQERWLVLNKIDLQDTEALTDLVQHLSEELELSRKVYCISAITGAGCKELCWDIFNWLEGMGDEDGDESA